MKRRVAIVVKRWLLDALRVFAVLGVIGVLVVVTGVVPITASRGHWAVTAWFLKFAMRRSIATHSMGIEVPANLDDPVLVLRGAGHYESGCLPCHGAPADPDPLIPQRMLPQPPGLIEPVAALGPKGLFYATKHGLKFTGMPAWPAIERDDEVWAVVAFLLRLPGLDARSYARLARGAPAPVEAEGDAEPLGDLASPPSAPRAVTESCSRCHGVSGGGRGIGAFPRIDGQPVEYLFEAMHAYADQTRPSGIMGPIAAGLAPVTWRELAEHYAGRDDRQARRSIATVRAVDAASLARGAAIASMGVPAQGVPSCEDCHGPTAWPRNPAYPELAGQYVEYLELQLQLWKRGARGGSPYAHLMEAFAFKLTDDQIRDVAGYYASLPRP
ncbi:MAG TPA: c-type cytochrome [Thermoanaerobaculia bacterium]|jgi:cytochrome c553|nr:c-type cytochrome [Thermoanaerobaculia bacterium]